MEKVLSSDLTRGSCYDFPFCRPGRTTFVLLNFQFDSACNNWASYIILELTPKSSAPEAYTLTTRWLSGMSVRLWSCRRRLDDESIQ